MLVTIIFFILGFIVLIKGADIMVDGSSLIAKKLGLSSFFIGLTIVAFGTSAPELVVSTLASFRDSSSLALGNIVGSNISNTLLILGVSALFAPLVLKNSTIKKEIPFSLLAIVVVWIMVNDVFLDGGSQNLLSRIDGLVLLLIFSIFIYYTIGISKDNKDVTKEIENEIGDPEKRSIWLAIGMVVAGLAGLALGGHWIVAGAIESAAYFGVSEALIGLTVVALGTSLPELAASAVAAKKGNTDIAVGNVIGSNIFNLFWVLGLSAVIRPIGYDAIMNFDFMVLLIITLVLFPLIYTGKKNILGKPEGYILIALYTAYVVFLFVRG
jgi:cation:H+ antiporter